MMEKENFNAGMVITVVPFAMFIVAAMVFAKCSTDNTDDYIITDKGANKIVYHSIANPGVNHVMTFDGDTVFKEGGFYPYLNVGDTITGNSRFMNEPVNYSLYYQGLRPPVQMTTIRTARGHTLRELREIARRDSLMREIKTKQR
ncbi:MAG: hypothetical protein K2I81_00410 [Alphaproteobacteria bacterium]|nr:hypothetical protein [Alphaproteobacteria bacterium]